MDRTYSTLTVFMMGLVAAGICVRQTIDVSDSLGSATTATLIFVEAVIVVVILAIVFSLVKRILVGRTIASRPTRFAAARQLRRLVSPFGLRSFARNYLDVRSSFTEGFRKQFGEFSVRSSINRG